MLDISNGVNTKVALQGSNHLLSVKRIKIDKELKISYWEHNLYRKKINQNPYMINKSQRYKMLTLLKSLKLVTLVQLVFTQFEICNHPTFPQDLIQNVLKLPN